MVANQLRDDRSVTAAEAPGALGDSIEHRLHVRRRTGDHLEDVGCGCLAILGGAKQVFEPRISDLGLSACVRRTSAYETWAEQIGWQSIGACGLAQRGWALSRVLLLFVHASPFAISHESLTNRGAGV